MVATLTQIPGILSVEHTTLHLLEKVEVEVVIAVDPELRVREAHAIACRARSALEDGVTEIDLADVHLELNDLPGKGTAAWFSGPRGMARRGSFERRGSSQGWGDNTHTFRRREWPPSS